MRILVADGDAFSRRLLDLMAMREAEQKSTQNEHVESALQQSHPIPVRVAVLLSPST